MVEDYITVLCHACCFQSPQLDPAIKELWRIWSHEQVSAKVFPVCSNSNRIGKVTSINIINVKGKPGKVKRLKRGEWRDTYLIHICRWLELKEP